MNYSLIRTTRMARLTLEVAVTQLIRVALTSGMLTVCLSTQPSGQRPASLPTLDLTRIGAVADGAAQSLVKSGGVPGLTVAVAKDGEIVFSKGYGHADVERRAIAGPETVYGTASITKQFTAAAIMRLAEAGKLELADPVTKHLPDYPVQGHVITLRHLLNHTSGIKGPAIQSESDLQRFRLDFGYSEMLDWFARQPPSFAPGEKHEYNNMAYYLLGEVVTRITGTSYENHVERELLRPLGLHHTFYCDPRRVIPDRAEGYDYEGGQLRKGRFVSMHILAGAGALCSTTGDLIRWTQLLHGGKVVAPASLQQMTARTMLSSGQTVDYGYGLYLSALEGHRKVYHGGSTQNGFGAYLSHYPDDGLTIAVLTNSARGRDRAAEIETAMARAAFRIELMDLPMTPQDIARYAGTYRLEGGPRSLELRVFAENGELKAQFGNGTPTRFRSQGNHAFIPLAADNFRYVFHVENGRAESVTLHQGDRSTFGKRMQ
jgi:D-alanyl-D-alanine carboxypeptidase